MKIALLSNINYNSIISIINEKYITYIPEGYGIWFQEIINENSNLWKFAPEIIFVFLDPNELLKNEKLLSEMHESMEIYINNIETTIKNNKKINFVISDFFYEEKYIKSLKNVDIKSKIEMFWNDKLEELNNRNNNMYIFSLKKLIEKNGSEYLYSPKMWYLGNIKYSIKGQEIVIKEIENYIKAIKGERKKVLVLDLDNTLWGGVIGEDGIDGIELSDVKEGSRFKNFQKRLKEIKETGIILCIVSKNNLQDVMEVFENHKDMILKKEDFVSMKVNWKSKIKNINELAYELNLGLDSFVFIDDNPVERENVKNELKNVIVPDFPKDTSNLEKFIIRIYEDYFLSSKLTEEDMEKTHMYQQNIKREELKKQVNTIDDFFKKLNTKIKIKKVDALDITRASQLTQKTNQFNLTIKRYNETEIAKMIEDEKYDVYIASVEDKFGDNGKVLLLIIEKLNPKEIKIINFLMSCRVMGRFIEDQIIDFIENIYYKDGYERIYSEFIKGQKNMPVEELFDRLDYDIIKKDEIGNKEYKLELNNKKIRNSFGELVYL